MCRIQVFQSPHHAETGAFTDPKVFSFYVALIAHYHDNTGPEQKRSGSR
jgi:hypothetical protein